MSFHSHKETLPELFFPLNVPWSDPSFLGPHNMTFSLTKRKAAHVEHRLKSSKFHK